MVGARIDDCSLWQSVRLEADAVRRVGGDSECPGWEEALAAARWEKAPGGPWPERPLELWNRAVAYEGVWEAAAGVALARLVAVAAGVRMVWEGPLSVLFSAAWEALFPVGASRLRVALAGPGVGEPDADVLVVPVHPRSGAVWRPSGSVPVVPLAAGAWAHLALPGGPELAVVSGRVPEEVLRGEVSVEMLSCRRSRPDREVFLDVLARLPQVREPGVRAVYDRVRGEWGLF
ncbi:hypothetical protein [Nocardiopsis sp. CC223A]|uniref:hypothetical protein n=1 Tax=Nocardiopsis sp. CC223A TaxID=3044051 RepID=UPI00278C0003|nr:hypothetical protein [Nocardiopsis sp. CC223A]